MSRFILLIWSVIIIMECSKVVAAENTNVEYLSDRTYLIVSSTQSWGQLGYDVAAHNPGFEPLPLQVKDKVYKKGLGTHAIGEIVVLLDGKYSQFDAEVGVQYQNGVIGSVVFAVMVDGKQKYKSKVVTESDSPIPVKISLKGAEEMRLIVSDGGNGISCDLGNWLNARMTVDPNVIAKPELNLDAAPFARVTASDPSRMDGARTNRLQEFNEEDLQLDTDILPNSDGSYTPKLYDETRVIGLRWLERRRLREASVEFAADSYIPHVEDIKIQVWIMTASGGSPGGSAWQGTWVQSGGEMIAKGNTVVYKPDINTLKLSPKGFLKIRWVFNNSKKPVVIKKMFAKTSTRIKDTSIVLRMDGDFTGKFADIEMYNGFVISPSGKTSYVKWDLTKPLELNVLYCDSKYWKTDRTVIRFKLPTGDVAVAVDDVINNSCVYVPDYKLFASDKSADISLADYKKKIASKTTVLQKVRKMPDQTLEQAMAKLHPASADLGPTLLSLAANNRKYELHRDGRIQFEQSEFFNNLIHHQGGYYNCSVNPKFGSGKNENLTRSLQGGWMPIPVIKVKDNGAIYTQRSYVAPYDNNIDLAMPVWYNSKPLFVAEITVSNTQKKEVDASIELDFIGDIVAGKKMNVLQSEFGVIANEPDKALVAVNTKEAISLTSTLNNGILALKGKLKPGSSAKCYIYIPGWEIGQDELGSIEIDDETAKKTEKYWTRLMAPSMKIDIPDKLLKNVILASQVHCWLAARNVDNRTISPWVGSINYGPLDSEGQSVIRGMEFMGQEDFARRSLDYFVELFNEAGYIKPLYTLMGTGWNLWTAGEFNDLYKDTEWMKKNASEYARVCDWIMRQRAKTMKVDSKGERLPEYGLNPPGAMADWEVFSYYFYSNGYFYAGLNALSKALMEIGYPNADKIVEDAADYRTQIERAYHYVQSKAPVFPLKNGTWVPEYPTQLYCPAPVEDFYPGEDFNRSWCYDIELGAHHMVPQGVLDPASKDVEWMMDHMEDVQFLREGWFDYPESENKKDPFNNGGFAKVQPYYARNGEVCAMRDDVKPFIRTYFNTMPTLLNSEDLSLWEHFDSKGAFNKTHETGYFLHQTRLMFVMERDNELWIAPFVTSNWMNNNESVSIKNAPTKFGDLSYTIRSFVDNGYIEAKIKTPKRSQPDAIVVRFRHPNGAKMKSVTVNGIKHTDFDPIKETVKLKSYSDNIVIQANY